MERTADREGSAWAPGIYDTRTYPDRSCQDRGSLAGKHDRKGASRWDWRIKKNGPLDKLDVMFIALINFALIVDGLR
jgi:hypothetical protein